MQREKSSTFCVQGLDLGPTYDGDHRLLKIYHPDGGIERFFYDAAGNRIGHILTEQYAEAQEEGAGWHYTYDEGNRLIGITNPEGMQESGYQYDVWGNCICHTDEKGYSTFYTYDLAGRLRQELLPVGKDKGTVRYRGTGDLGRG
ncbi:MAG: hypothetical protein IKL49_12230, partial [Lachnospiraceae bacterium]|nr:hypothetical protein [Lachnospiraceae bacterium]